MERAKVILNETAEARILQWGSLVGEFGYPEDASCQCDIKDLMSVGHNNGCVEKK